MNNTISKIKIDSNIFDINDKNIQDALSSMSELLKKSESIDSVVSELSDDEKSKLNENLTTYLYGYLKMLNNKSCWE